MAKFRFHKGTLEESLKTEIEMNSKSDLCDFISRTFQSNFSKESLIIQYYGFDNRLNKDIHSVRIYGLGIVGFLDSELV